jgi:hypothetical protein
MINRKRTPHMLEFMPVYCPDVNAFLHYTCNPPKGEVLTKEGILPLGNSFGCEDSREVLLIPESVFSKIGLNPNTDKHVATIHLENLMRSLS